jgi:tRNA A-37 threonylcarbamoyl transferase component Bud32
VREDTLVDVDRDSISSSDVVPSLEKTVTDDVRVAPGPPRAPDLDDVDTDVFGEKTKPQRPTAPTPKAKVIAEAPTQITNKKEIGLATDSSSEPLVAPPASDLQSLGDTTQIDTTRPNRLPQVDDVFTDSHTTTNATPSLSQRRTPEGPTQQTAQFRLEEIVAPPRLRDVAKPVDVALGGYHVHHFLGSGGMSVVYLARAPGIDHDVVVKRVRPERLNDRKHVGRFIEEARVALQLRHPNIVRTLDHAQDGREHFIVMEFLDGYDLRHLTKRLWAADKTVPIEPLLLALAQAARGLDYAHKWAGADGNGTGLVHRDVSPENLFLTEEGVTKVVDFGLAVAWDSKRFSSTGEVMGKVPYLSPEAVNGLVLDGRSDVFSLCVTAWWLLTGRRPFKRKNAMLTLRAILDEDPAPLREVNPRIPPAVGAILRKGLEKDRRWRYHEARDLADALEDAAGEADLPDDALRQLLYAADGVPPAPDVVTAPNPPAIPWAEWRQAHGL